ncbi:MULTISPECIES: hypothetical protein [Bacillus cereus group]|uniref:PXO2-44 n=1 Tax=Bacillus paranthracis TaxID=2026186 RepID=A0AAJ1K6E6_9BACI|nr:MULTISPECIES: hypothetical protein [Bacillus cereus group]MBR9741431.1 hypothetical protein [Bacillus paranthracis]MDA2073756.1 hypothetical protein [Bacillus cereus]MDG0949514.1 hypothetical protein [Bacillus paranthracis]MDG0955346.1 hypothetical protein [Bacillus paranthracis]MDX5778286.1 hypothetical protein [Bacillus cereus group sp. DSM 4312]
MVNQNVLHHIGYEILQETFVLIRNVFSYSSQDESSVTYVREIADALHNIPHSIQKQHDKFLEFEFKLLEETLMQMDFGKVAAQNIPYFRMYAARVQQLLQKRYKGV